MFASQSAVYVHFFVSVILEAVMQTCKLTKSDDITETFKGANLVPAEGREILSFWEMTSETRVVRAMLLDNLEVNVIEMNEDGYDLLYKFSIQFIQKVGTLSFKHIAQEMGISA
jgi:hypothetical protein